MKYIVIEIQSNNGSVGHLFDAYDDWNLAQSKYHTVLAAAAVSAVEVHTAILCNDSGETLEYFSYEHKQPEPEPEPEEENT